MTAKEIIRERKHPIHGYYVFERYQLEDFAKLICKEQRELCAKEVNYPYRALIEEFRCPKCQNQNLAGSDAPIAQDLKQKTYELVKDGRSDAEIRQYMYERYGDFISYKPPVRPSTWILWFFPPLLLALVLLGWFIKHRHSNQRKQLTEAQCV